MANVNRSPFHPYMEFTVAREFVFNGRTMKPGWKFNWVKLGCSERLLRQLYEQRKLNGEVTARAIKGGAA